MAMTLQVRSRSQALSDMATALGVHGSPQLVTVGVIASQLRALCEACSACERQGIHTSRLVETVLRNVSGIVDRPADVRTVVHRVLETLRGTGDLWRSQGGFWHATPARAISIPSGDAFLLGALSASPETLIAQGVVRYAANAVPPNTPVQSIDDWLGHEDPIGIWTEKALRHYGKRLLHSGLSSDHLQIYAPDQVGRHSRSSWVDASEFTVTARELRLCRAIAAKTEIYDRPYYLGEFGKNGTEVSLLRAASLAHGHSRRFRFGFDDRLSAHRLLHPKQEGATVHLTIANDLPLEEERVLSLGWSAGNAASQAVRQLLFPTRAMPFVAHALRRLGVLIEEGTT